MENSPFEEAREREEREREKSGQWRLQLGDLLCLYEGLQGEREDVTLSKFPVPLLRLLRLLRLLHHVG